MTPRPSTPADIPPVHLSPETPAAAPAGPPDFAELWAATAGAPPRTPSAPADAVREAAPEPEPSAEHAESRAGFAELWKMAAEVLSPEPPAPGRPAAAEAPTGADDETPGAGAQVAGPGGTEAPTGAPRADETPDTGTPEAPEAAAVRTGADEESRAGASAAAPGGTSEGDRPQPVPPGEPAGRDESRPPAVGAACGAARSAADAGEAGPSGVPGEVRAGRAGGAATPPSQGAGGGGLARKTEAGSGGGGGGESIWQGRAGQAAGAPGGAVRRRGPADPVRQVMHRHQALIAGAVDVWEIAAGLEAHGVTDVDARRLRHRDVFGLAEELYARVPRAGQAAPGAPGEREGAWLHPFRAARYLLPGAGCAVAARFLPSEAVTAFVVLAAYAVLRRGPLHARGRQAALWACGLLALTAPTAPGLAVSLVPAAYAAHWFAVRARAQLAPSHGLDDFADAVRPRLAAALAGYAAVLVALLGAAGPVAASAALGLLLFTTRLLALHGRPASAAAVLAAACAAEALYRSAAALGPGGPHGTPQALVCGAAAAVAVVQAFRVLPRAAAHRST
jgi:hypothetical protein